MDACPNYKCFSYSEEEVFTWSEIISNKSYSPPGESVKFPTKSGTPVIYYPNPGSRFDDYSNHPWRPGDVVLYLGEIIGMSEHGIFVANDGRVHWGFHIFKIYN
jgi:hypothetical protein